MSTNAGNAFLHAYQTDKRFFWSMKVFKGLSDVFSSR